MPEQHKQQIRIYLRPSALAKAAERGMKHTMYKMSPV